MSAAALTKQLLSIDYVKNEGDYFRSLAHVLNEFLSTRNPIFPRQDVIVNLMKVLTCSTSTTLIQLVLTTLIEFCNKSTSYDANFVKRQLISLKIVKIICFVLSGKRLYAHRELSECCLSLLRRLSDVLLPTELQITLNDIIPLCVSLCDCKKRTLFMYRTKLDKMLQSMMLNRKLVIREYGYDTAASKEKCDLMYQLFGCKTLQLTHCIGDLFDTNTEVDTNIGETIVRENLAWFSLNTTTNSTRQKTKSDTWRDVIPCEIIIGPHFFAHELDKINQVSDIELILQDFDHVALASAPEPGDLVTVWGEIRSPHCGITSGQIYYRAQVAGDLTEESMYSVLSLDYGSQKKVKLSQLYQPCQALIHIMPSVTLCTIRGIQPCPFSLTLLDTALSILQTLTLGNFTISECMVNQWSALSVLTDLASISSEEHICCKTMILLAHIANNGRVRANAIVTENTIHTTIRLISQYEKMGWRQAVMESVTALSAMLYTNPAANSQIEQGLPELMGILSHYNRDSDLHAALQQVIRNYLHSTDLTKPNDIIDQLEVVRSPQSITNESTEHPLAAPITDHQLPDIMPAEYRTAHKYLTSIGSSDSETVTERVGRGMTRSVSAELDRRAKSVDVCERRSRSGSRHRRLDLSQLNEQLRVSDGESSVSRSSKSRSSYRDYHILGEKTALKSSSNCEIFPSDTSMDCLSVSKLLAGFLNSGSSGQLIYGVTHNGIINGIRIDRDRRDQLRLGLDRICTDFSPTLTYNRPALHFIPVCVSEGADDVSLRTAIRDQFVVEISVDANIGLDQAYKLKNDDRIFIRYGTKNTEGTTQDLRSLITNRMEAEILN